MAYTSSIIDDSPTKVFKTAADLTGGAFTALELGGSGVNTAGASSVPIGLLIGEYDLPIPAGSSVTAQIRGGSLWLAGESIAAGDFLAAGKSGVAVKATTGKFIFAQALENAKANQAAQVQIINAGYKN